jgi:myo-inositol-1-phosphate synthase
VTNADQRRGASSSTPPPTRWPATGTGWIGFVTAGLPLLGDDLASQFGTSVVHHALVRLLEERGLTLTSSYQVNLGGIEDFSNLVEHSNTEKPQRAAVPSEH